MSLSKRNGVSWPYLILFLSACFPFTFGAIGNLPDLMFVEWMAPLAVIIGANRLLKRGQSFFPYGARAPVIATTLLLFVALAHFIFHPVSSSTLLGAGEGGGGIRAYFTMFIGYCILVYAVWSSRYWIAHDGFWEKLLWYILWASLLIGYARLITYLLDVQIPFLTGHYLSSEKNALVDKPDRIGGLNFAASLGLSALAGIYYQRKWSTLFILLLLALLFLVVMSGGRGFTIAVVFAFFIYLVLIRKEVGRATLMFALALAVIAIASQFTLFDRQFERMTRYEGGVETQASGRLHAFKIMWHIFLDNMLIGKGIGYHSIPKGTPSGALNVVSTGGHGSYTSMLGLFGLTGIYFLAITLFGTILRSLLYVRKYAASQLLSADRKMMLCFIIFQLTIMSVEFLVGGTGYNNMRLYLLAGIGAGIISRFRYAN